MLFKDSLELNLFWFNPTLTALLLFLLFSIFLVKDKDLNCYFFFSYSQLFYLAAPIACLTFILLLCFRALLGTAAFGYFLITSFFQPWAVLIFLIFVFNLLASKHWTSLWSMVYTLELMVAIFILCYLWTVVILARSTLSLLLFLELAGLCLLICFIKSSELSFTRNSSNFAINAIILFLWTSIVSILLMLSGLLLTVEAASPQFEILRLMAIFINPTELTFNVFLYVAVFLKLMLLPWHGVLLSFYKNLPINSFLFYLTYYYPAFIVVGPMYLIPILILTSNQILVIWCGILVSAIITGVSTFSQTLDLKAALAISSIFNITLLVLICAL